MGGLWLAVSEIVLGLLWAPFTWPDSGWALVLGSAGVSVLLAMGGAFFHEVGQRVLARRRGSWVLSLALLAPYFALCWALTGGRRLQAVPLRWLLVLVIAAGISYLSVVAWRTALRFREGQSGLWVRGLSSAVVWVLVFLDLGTWTRLYPSLHWVWSLGAVWAVAVAFSGFQPPAWFSKPKGWAWAVPLLSAAALSVAVTHAVSSGSMQHYWRTSHSITGSVAQLIPSSAPPAAIGREPAPDYSDPNAGPRRPDASLLVITVDALRADALGSDTPFLTELQSTSVVFEQAYTTTPNTSYAITSLMTGVSAASPHFNAEGARTFVDALEVDQSEASFSPAIAFVDAPRFAPLFERSFGFREASVDDRSAEELVSWLEGRLRQVDPEKRAVFWVHLMEPHEPYAPPPEYRGDAVTARDLYRGEVRASDAAVGRMVRSFRRVFPNSVVTVTSDHGEEFEEHGGAYHGTTLFDEQMRIPLIVSVPGLLPRVVRGAVMLTDVAPTLLWTLGARPTPEMAGRNLLVGEVTEGLAFAQLGEQRMVTDGRFKVICRGLEECYLYTLSDGERSEVSAAHPERLAHLRGELLRHVRARSRGASPPVSRVREAEAGVPGDRAELLAIFENGPGPLRARALRAFVFSLLGGERAAEREVLALERAAHDADPQVELLGALGLACADSTMEPAVRVFSSRAISHPNLLALSVAALLAQREEPSPRPFLRGVIDHREYSLVERQTAIRVLSQYQTPHISDTERLAVFFSAFEHPSLRLEVISALAEVGGDEAEGFLFQRFEEEPYPLARYAGAKALLLLNPERAQPIVCAAIAGGMDPPPGLSCD